MKNKLIFSISLVLLISCGTSTDSKSGTVSFKENNIDLGTITNTEIQTIPLTVTNSSKDKIDIINILKSCGCTQLDLKKRSLGPKSKLTFHLKYDPRDDPGKIERSVVLRLSNDDFLIFKFKGMVTNKKP